MTANIINIVGNVVNPPTTSVTDQSTPPLAAGRQGDLLVSEVHGKFYGGAYRGAAYSAQVNAVAILKVIATGVVNVFALWQPTSSTVLAEMISTEIINMVATTVVDAFGWYRSSNADAAASTFTTAATAVSSRVGQTATNQMIPYSALTLPNSAAPIRVDLIGGLGAVTNTGQVIRKEYNGTFLIPPGNLLSLLASTTDSQAVGQSIAVHWAEWPL